MKNRKNRKGFTLVELVIVIGVIGILAGILIPTFVGVTGKAQDAAKRSDLANAYSMYAVDAADGKVGEDGAALSFLAQDAVVLATKADKTADKAYGYKFVNQVWTVEDAALSGMVGTATQPISSVAYNGYYVWALAA